MASTWPSAAAGASRSAARRRWGRRRPELSLALILALARNIVAEDRSLRAGTWETQHIGSTLHGRTLGLLGLGKLGTAVAAMGRAFGMDPIAWSPNLTPERAAAGGARLVDKPTLFATADYLSIHLVLSDRSRGIVGAAEIAAMQPSACLVNTSRAGLVDEAALIAALHAGRLRGAGLDVFEQEPLPLDAPILAAPQHGADPPSRVRDRRELRRLLPAGGGGDQGVEPGQPDPAADARLSAP